MLLKQVALLFFILSTLSIFSSVSANETKPLRIAVASNFTYALQQLLPEFSEITGIQVDVISGASGSLFQQIKHGAPFDVFLSADSIRPQNLEQQQLIIEGSRHAYALGLLAFYSAHSFQNKPLNFQHFIDNIPSAKRIAIANPDIAPYGESAKQVFTNLSLWQEINDKLILGINVNQTFQQAQSGAVDGGIIALSQLIQIDKNSEENHIPLVLYQPINQQMVILKSSKNIAAATTFQQYLLSDKVQSQIAQLGYLSVNGHNNE